MVSWTARGLLHTIGGRIVESHHTERMFGMAQCLALECRVLGRPRDRPMVITTDEPCPEPLACQLEPAQPSC
jgi:hypothetical protein